MISLFHPFVPEEAIEEVVSTLRSKYISQGQKVKDLESKFQRMFNVKYPVSLNSGTSALELAYDLAGLKAGDEVISTPLTCSATNIPLIRRGCKIIWADVLEKTLCIDPLDVRAKITDKTKAIIQVHLGGIRADCGWMHKDIMVISDACQALGIFNGDYTCCSFQAIKHCTTGDGGMIVCPDEGSYKKAKLLRWFGIDRDTPIVDDWTSYRTRMMSFDIELAGYKYHMNDIAAGMGIAGLKYYDAVLTHRRNLFSIYRNAFSSIDGIKIVDGVENVYWLATVLVEDRDNFARMLKDYDIETNVVQVRNDQYKIFGGKRAELPVLNSIEGKYISLPIGMHVSVEDTEYICDLIAKGW